MPKYIIKYLPLILLSIVGILALRIYVEHTNDTYTTELEYTKYEDSSRDNYQSFKNHILDAIKDTLGIRTNKVFGFEYQNDLKMVSNQFEGPQVHLKSFTYQYGKDDKRTFSRNVDEDAKRFINFDIHSLEFDPDNEHTGKPNVKIQVTPPRPYEEQRSASLQRIFDEISGDAQVVSPYKSFNKEVYSIKNDSVISIENVQIDLWLTEFSVTIETQSWRHRRDVDDDGKSEIANQRLNPFEIELEILPNVSPWYVNTGKSWDVKSDMAIGAIYCKSIVKDPKNANMGMTPSVISSALPLVKQSKALASEDIKDAIRNVSDRTVWNKPVYAKIVISNIGSYRNLLGSGDEQITYKFIMPLLVLGSWDIQIPSSIIPEFKAQPPYKRGLHNILLPKWGLRGIWGGVLSSMLYLIVLVLIIFKFVF